jgi:hypothetical protein
MLEEKARITIHEDTRQYIEFLYTFALELKIANRGIPSDTLNRLTAHISDLLEKDTP